MGGVIHKIALYADDILLFLSSPEGSIPVTMSLLEEFSSVSGYKVNLDKSEAMPVDGLDIGDLTEDFPFRCSNSGFTYLGIKVSPNLSELWKLNISPTICAVKRDLQRWSNLPLSFMGRISLIKMNVLPRILYPLQMLPLWMPRKVASSIEKLFSEFVWHGKKPREKNKDFTNANQSWWSWPPQYTFL